MKNISKRAKYLIAVSAVYFLVAVGCLIYKPFPHAVEGAQLLYVLALGLPLLFPSIGKRIGVKSLIP